MATASCSTSLISKLPQNLKHHCELHCISGEAAKLVLLSIGNILANIDHSFKITNVQTKFYIDSLATSISITLSFTHTHYIIVKILTLIL